MSPYKASLAFVRGFSPAGVDGARGWRGRWSISHTTVVQANMAMTSWLIVGFHAGGEFLGAQGNNPG
jgi:hypothetical protein